MGDVRPLSICQVRVVPYEVTVESGPGGVGPMAA